MLPGQKFRLSQEDACDHGCEEDMTCSQTTLAMNALAAGGEVLLSLPDEQLMADAILFRSTPGASDDACCYQGPTTEEEGDCIMIVEVALAKEGGETPLSDAATGIFVKIESNSSCEDSDEEEWGECSPAQRPPKRSVSPTEAPDGPESSPTVTCHGPSSPATHGAMSWGLDKLIKREPSAPSSDEGEDEDDVHARIMGDLPTVFSSQESSSSDAPPPPPPDNAGSVQKEEGAKSFRPPPGARTKPLPIYQTQFVEKLGHEVTGVMVDKMTELAALLDALEGNRIVSRTVYSKHCDNPFEFDEMAVHDVPAFNNAIRTMIFRLEGPWIDYRGPGNRPTRRVYDCFNYCGVSPARCSRGPPEFDPRVTLGEQDFLYSTRFTFSVDNMLANSYRMCVNAHTGGARHRVAVDVARGGTKSIAKRNRKGSKGSKNTSLTPLVTSATSPEGSFYPTGTKPSADGKRPFRPSSAQGAFRPSTETKANAATSNAATSVSEFGPPKRASARSTRTVRG